MSSDRKIAIASPWPKRHEAEGKENLLLPHSSVILKQDDMRNREQRSPLGNS